MKQIVVSKVHNNQISRICSVSSEEKAVAFLKSWMVNDGIDITPEIEDEIDNELSYYNDDDMDNIVTYSIDEVSIVE